MIQFRIRAFARPLFVLLALTLAVGAGWAQEKTGKISGTVTDPSGAVIPGAGDCGESQ